jgi:hypothetical protein
MRYVPKSCTNRFRVKFWVDCATFHDFSNKIIHPKNPKVKRLGRAVLSHLVRPRGLPHLHHAPQPGPPRPSRPPPTPPHPHRPRPRTSASQLAPCRFSSRFTLRSSPSDFTFRHERWRIEQFRRTGWKHLRITSVSVPWAARILYDLWRPRIIK